jgi:hypothetical protein
MLLFVTAVNNFLVTRISSHTSIPEALKDFSNKIYSKVNCNIMHLEVMLKSLLITNDFDLSVPVVTDPENVKFMGIKNLSIRRTLGTFFAYERILSSLKNPLTYTMPKMSGMFDAFCGFKE